MVFPHWRGPTIDTQGKYLRYSVRRPFQLKIAGTASSGDNTVFIDEVAIEVAELSTDNEPVAILPESFSLVVSPNPFNPSVNISYYLPRKASVSLTLYNTQGKVVRKLGGGMESAGRHTAQVEAGWLASGVYICEFKNGAATKRLKLVLMR